VFSHVLHSTSLSQNLIDEIGMRKKRCFVSKKLFSRRE